MLTQTTESAIKGLIYLVLYGTDKPLPPRLIAHEIGTSPTYMAKITRMLVKANILRSHRGALGGVSLSRPPDSVTLREVVEACQGLLVGNYCQSIRSHPDPVCAFHESMVEVHEAMIGVLEDWTLADLSNRPAPGGCDPATSDCKIGLLIPGACGTEKDKKAKAAKGRKKAK